MMEAVPAAVVIAHDPDCRTITGNGELFDMLRLPYGDNKSLSAAPAKSATPFRIMRDGAEIPPRELPLQIAAQQGVDVRASMMELHFDDGTVRHIFGHATPLRGSDGTLRGAIGAFVDLTDQRRAEEALKDADRRKDEFLAMLAHELRNPLAPMRNALEILRLKGDDIAVIEHTRGMLERQLQMLVRLVDDLLDVSRISTGKIELRPERIDMVAAVAAAVDTARPHVEARGHALSVSVPPHALWVDADPTRLAQTFANLLDNAAKYTKSGGSIRVCVTSDGSLGAVSVKDTGIGIPADMLGRIFDLFAQVDQSVERSYGGLGIGLTLVKRLIELHRGSIEARSAGPGHGSEFIMRLPLAGPCATAADEAASPAASVEVPPGYRILVVDDNVDAAATLGMLLELLGHRVQIAHDGRAALQAADAFKPDAVFLDIGLPEINGYQVAQRMRGDPNLARTYIVALSGYGSTLDQARSLKSGFDIHVVKPIEPQRLQELLLSISKRGPDGRS